MCTHSEVYRLQIGFEFPRVILRRALHDRFEDLPDNRISTCRSRCMMSPETMCHVTRLTSVGLLVSIGF